MSDNRPDDGKKIGVLLLNLGTPEGTDFWSVRRYLKEFLSDRRVIEVGRFKWWLILNLIILNFRPKKTGTLYEKIWDREANDSPLRVISASQADKLQTRFNDGEMDGQVKVEFAMRYGTPSTASRLQRLKDAGCERILLVPLYPQYSATTTASANDKAFEALKSMRWQPAIRTLPPYYAEKAYIEALALSVTSGLEKLGFVPEKVIVSFHGMPQSYVDKGDPYFEHCKKTTTLLNEKLGWPEGRLMLAFQSRFGKEEWLKPYLDGVLKDLPAKGNKKIAVLAPAFSVDCLETLEELAMDGQELFKEAGGTDFAYIPCLNDSEYGMDAIEMLVRAELGGWV